MSERTRNIYDMFVSTTEFDRLNAADYSGLPDAALQFAIVRDVITKLEVFLADQTSGKRGQAVEQKSVLMAAAKRKMKEYSAAARALNLDDAGFRRLFRVPNGDGVGKFVASGREFVEEAAAHQAQFARFGLTAADAAALAEDLDDLEAAVAAKAAAAPQTVGATAGIDDEIERGMAAETFLDALIKIIYRNDAAKLAAWKSARHVRRSKRTTQSPTS